MSMGDVEERDRQARQQAVCELHDAISPIRSSIADAGDETVLIEPQQLVSRRRPPKKPPPERLSWFDQWRGARGPALRSLVATIKETLDKHEKAVGERQRARRPYDQRRYEIAVETVVANLAHSALFDTTDKPLAILTGNKSRGFTRYENDALGKPLRRLLDSLVALGLVEWKWSPMRGEASSVAPTERLATMVREAGIQKEDFGRLENEEVIRLSRKRKIGEWWERRIERDEIDYTGHARD